MSPIILIPRVSKSAPPSVEAIEVTQELLFGGERHAGDYKLLILAIEQPFHWHRISKTYAMYKFAVEDMCLA